MGVARGARVCILAQRSIQLVVAILATLKAGASYVPLDGSIVTQSTLEHVLHDSGAALVLAHEEFRGRVNGVPVVSIGSSVVRDESVACVKPKDVSQGSDSVYIIYTSGASGASPLLYIN